MAHTHASSHTLTVEWEVYGLEDAGIRRKFVPLDWKTGDIICVGLIIFATMSETSMCVNSMLSKELISATEHSLRLLSTQ